MINIDLPIPIITPRLLIRPPQLGDGPEVNRAIIDSFEKLHEFMPWAKEKPSLEETEHYIRLAAANWILKKNEDPYLPLWIFRQDTMEFIGGTGYHNINWEIPAFETGYWLHSQHHNQGFGTEATNAITQYGFKQLGAKRITITCDIDNIRSKKIAERLHYNLEGVLKCHRRKPINNELSDTMVYAKYDLEDLPPLSVEWGSK